MSDSDSKPVAVPRQVHCELKTLRQLGTHDPFSEEILEAAAAYNFEAAREWIVEHPEQYVRAVYAGTEDETLAGTATDEG